MDYSALVSAISFSTVGPAVMTGAGALVSLYVIIKGVKVIIGLVRGGGGHKITISRTSSMTAEQSQRLFEEADRMKGEFRRGERAHKDY